MIAEQQASGRFNASTILDRQVAAGSGPKPAIHCGDLTVTYAELLQRVCQAGNVLIQLGISPWDRILLTLDDGPAFPAFFLGAIRMGAVPVPVNPLFKSEDYTFLAEDSGARLVVVGPENADKLTAAISSISSPPRLVSAGGPGNPSSLDQMASEQPGSLEPATTTPDAEAFWLYSSGSTGKPKGVVHRQRDLDCTYETYGRQVLGIRHEDVSYSTSKMFHAYGLGNSLSFPYSVGATTILGAGRPSPDAIFANIQRFRPTILFSVPTLYNALLNAPGAETQDLSSVRICASAAEPLPGEIWERWNRTFGVTIIDGIGSTEMAHIYCSNSEGATKPGSSGRPVPGYSLRILDEESNEVPSGESGNLSVRGDSMFREYWNRPEKTADSFRDGWFSTGDRYHVDGDGFYWYEGRADDMMKVGGLWVSPIEMENVLLEHASVREAAVVGIPVEGLMRVKAFICLRPATIATPELVAELSEFCKSRLERYQYPHFIEFLDELPKTVTGKILRYQLRRQDPGGEHQGP